MQHVFKAHIFVVSRWFLLLHYWNVEENNKKYEIKFVAFLLYIYIFLLLLFLCVGGCVCVCLQETKMNKFLSWYSFIIFWSFFCILLCYFLFHTSFYSFLMLKHWNEKYLVDFLRFFYIFMYILRRLQIQNFTIFFLQFLFSTTMNISLGLHIYIFLCFHEFILGTKFTHS